MTAVSIGFTNIYTKDHFVPPDKQTHLICETILLRVREACPDMAEPASWLPNPPRVSVESRDLRGFQLKCENLQVDCSFEPGKLHRKKISYSAPLERNL